MRRLNLDQLQSFLAVAETGSFSEAGRRLNLTQSAVSQQIKELEARLGTRILDRLGKKAHPTPAGEELREHARRLIQQSDLVVESMRVHRDGGWGRLRLATSATLAAYVLPPILLKLRERYPRLEVAVTAGSAGKVLRQVAENLADLAFVNMPGPVTEPALSVHVASESSLMAFWPRAYGPPPKAVRPDHLAGRPFIFYTPGTLTYDLVHGWFEKAGCKPGATMEFESGLSIIGLIDAGLGASILPSEVQHAAVTLRNLVVRPIEPAITTRLHVAIHKDKPRHEALRVVHAALLSARIGDRKRTRST
jgi:DNA-binding transcriptional LysR family regulator